MSTPISTSLGMTLCFIGPWTTLGENVVWQPARSDFPALIVMERNDTGTTVDIDCSGVLDETASGVNFNPQHTPYFGGSDADMTDAYDAGFYLKRARVLEAAFGTSGYHRERYAELCGV